MNLDEAIICIVLAATQRLREHVDELNAMNVTPTPDHDTGTNMLATMEAGLVEVSRRYGACPTSFECIVAMSRGTMNGAHGGSGVILANMLYGTMIGVKDELSLKDVAQLAFSKAKASVLEPMAGGMLDTLQLIGNTILISDTDVIDALAKVVTDVKETKNTDAGSQGLIYMLEGAVDYIRGIQ